MDETEGKKRVPQWITPEAKIAALRAAAAAGMHLERWVSRAILKQAKHEADKGEK